MAQSILRSIFGRLIGLDGAGNFVFRGRYIYYGDDTGPTPAGVIDCTSISGGGGPGTWPNGGPPAVSVTANLPSGPSDDLEPGGYVAGTTNQIVFVPAVGGSALGGLVAPGVDGFVLDGFNGSSTDNLDLINQSPDSSVGNRLLIATGSGPSSIPPLQGFTMKWMASIAGQPYWTFR